MSKNSILIVLTLTFTALVMLVFAIWPESDLAATRYFYGMAQFAGSSASERLMRRILYIVPLIIPLAMLILWAVAKSGAKFALAYAPAGRSMFFVLACLTLTPGLLVNGVLKEVSGRPRPVHVKEFGGSAEFRPWYRFDGPCQSNCSFVSGEVSSSMTLIAPASLLPAPYNAVAIAGAFAFTIGTGYLRMSFGGHFLTDVLFAMLFTLLAVQLLHLMIMRRTGPRA